ncbi:hypothetical protein ROT00_07400 [Agromyces mediolanus]|uniref:hypothetical protein n=1 Tax=Agromyces mediolanus TaxID=41986 RepID=UPI0038363136
MPADAPSLIPPVLAELYAVVLRSERSGVRVLWGREDQCWLRSSSWGQPGFEKQETAEPAGAGERLFRSGPHVPAVEDVAAAAAVAETFRAAGFCQWCERDELVVHALVPDVWDEPRLYCILRPHPTAVASSGGGGTVKHFGSPFGCTHVGTSSIWQEGYVPVGHHLYGEPLTTLDVIEREWCAKCVNAAHNGREYVRGQAAERLGRVPTDEELRQAMKESDRRRSRGAQIRYLLDEVDGRGKKELLLEMRAGMMGQSVEDYQRMAKERGW